MMQRVFSAALLLGTAACTTPVTAATTPDADSPWACRDVLRSAVVQAYALARFRDDQRAVILLPAGTAVAEYEAETKRLRDEGGRLMEVLKANDPTADGLPPPAPVSPQTVTEEKVTTAIAAADACVANAAG